MIKNKIPSLIRLDNAGTLYPCTLYKKYAAMFRMTITLKEKNDSEILQKALNTVIKRFPSFRYELRQGIFWYYNWSIYAALPITIIGIMLLILSYNDKAVEEIKQRMFI